MQAIQLKLSALAYPNIDPIIFSIGPVSIHWYGLAYVVGLIFGWIYAKNLAVNTALWPKTKHRITAFHIDDFIIWAAFGIVLGGRIGYIFFYDFSAIMENPIRAFQIWNGGMSFHGGILGVIVAMIWFSKSRKISTWSLMDLIATVVPIGLFFGRIANFINSELWGKITDVPWAFVFPNGGPFTRHPSQLYEAALEGALTLVILAIFVFKFKWYKHPGMIAGLFVVLYALSRIFVEFYRQPDLHIGYLMGNWLTMGMLLSLPMLAVGIWALYNAQKRPQKK